MAVSLHPIGFDASLLINFGEVDALHILLGATPVSRFITGHVHSEVRRHPTRARLDTAIRAGQIDVVTLTAAEMQTWARLAQRLGEGEASLIAVAKHREWVVGLDDRVARRAAERELRKGMVTGTIGLLIAAVRLEVVEHHQAQALLDSMVAAGFWSPTRTLPAP